MAAAAAAAVAERQPVPAAAAGGGNGGGGRTTTIYDNNNREKSNSGRIQSLDKLYASILGRGHLRSFRSRAKISEIFAVRAARPKISEIFGRAALASGAVFRVIYLSLAVCAAARRSA